MRRAAQRSACREYLRGYRERFDMRRACASIWAARLRLRRGGRPTLVRSTSRRRPGACKPRRRGGIHLDRSRHQSGCARHRLRIGASGLLRPYDRAAIVRRRCAAARPPRSRHALHRHVLGARVPDPLPRYGIAYEAEIYVGKVLSNQGRGGDGDILAGINWAVQNGCAWCPCRWARRLRRPKAVDSVREYGTVRLPAQGTLIVAAAGNGKRPATPNPSSRRLAIRQTALDHGRGRRGLLVAVAWFSNAGQNQWRPGRYRRTWGRRLLSGFCRRAITSFPAPAWRRRMWPASRPCTRRPIRAKSRRLTCGPGWSKRPGRSGCRRDIGSGLVSGGGVGIAPRRPLIITPRAARSERSSGHPITHRGGYFGRLQGADRRLCRSPSPAIQPLDRLRG